MPEKSREKLAEVEQPAVPEPEPEPEPKQDDVMAEIMKMRAAAETGLTRPKLYLI